jgi:hypothetical protein
MEVETEQLNELEALLIEKFKPPLNEIKPLLQIPVATCNHNRSNLQSRHFQTRIIYNYKFSPARINCK